VAVPKRQNQSLYKTIRPASRRYNHTGWSAPRPSKP